MQVINWLSRAIDPADIKYNNGRNDMKKNLFYNPAAAY